MSFQNESLRMYFGNKTLKVYYMNETFLKLHSEMFENQNNLVGVVLVCLAVLGVALVWGCGFLYTLRKDRLDLEVEQGEETDQQEAAIVTFKNEFATY